MHVCMLLKNKVICMSHSVYTCVDALMRVVDDTFIAKLPLRKDIISL